MGKLQKNQSGFSAIEALLILVIVGILGFTGWFVWQAKQNTDKSLTPNSSTTPVIKKKTTTNATSPTKPSPATSATFKIPELGIQIVNVPSSINDLNYAINPNGAASGDTIAEISTITLSKLDPQCSPTGHVSAVGTLASIKGTYDPNSGPQDNTAFVKQFSGFWISYSHPESQCSDNSTTEALHVSQTATFDTLATNPANLQAL
jgi:hypothetical protein